MHPWTAVALPTVPGSLPATRPTSYTLGAPRVGEPIEDRPMNDQVERRVADQDPVDVMSAEVFSLLRLCGGLPATDVQGSSSRAQRRAVAPPAV